MSRRCHASRQRCRPGFTPSLQIQTRQLQRRPGGARVTRADTPRRRFFQRSVVVPTFLTLRMWLTEDGRRPAPDRGKKFSASLIAPSDLAATPQTSGLGCRGVGVQTFFSVSPSHPRQSDVQPGVGARRDERARSLQKPRGQRGAEDGM